MPIVADPTAYVPAQVCHLDLRQISWRATGSFLGEGADPRARLSATLQIGGADHHLDAIEVDEIDGVQCGVNGAESEFDDLCMFAGGDGHFETISIEGRDYVLGLSPFKT